MRRFSPRRITGEVMGKKDSFNIFELSTNKDGGEMLKHLDLGDQSPVEVREAQSVNGPLAVLNEYYDMYVTQPADAKWRLDNMHETYLKDMKSKYVYPNVFMSIDDTNKVSQYDTDIKKYAEQKKSRLDFKWRNRQRVGFLFKENGEIRAFRLSGNQTEIFRSVSGVIERRKNKQENLYE